MRQDRKAFYGWLGGFALLTLVSVYRQLSLRLLPGDPARPYIVYAVYLALLAGWGESIRDRITQKSMRVFLLMDDGVMLFWLTIRFLQDAFLEENIYLMRLLGYFIAIPAAALPLLGLYAAYGLGRGDDYRMPERRYLLLLPAAALIAASLTNEHHHFMYSAAAGEPQPNLYFHPYIGIYLLYLWVLVLVLARVLVIVRRNRPAGDAGPLRRIAPFLEILLLVLFCTPYTLSSFLVNVELIEFSAGIFFIEAVSWELFIAIGLIPVNAQYEEVFDRSTVAMQLVSEDGAPLVRSGRAPALPPDLFGTLRSRGSAAAPDGQELQLFPVRGGYLVWEKDVSRLRRVIRELRQSAEELQQEGTLLSRELRLKSEEAAVAEQNRIYNALSREVGPQLALLDSLLRKADAAPDKTALFRQICLVGAYVKRRCNLRLIEQSDGVIAREDLDLSLRDLLGCLGALGTETGLSWQDGVLPSPAFALLTLDLLEFLTEYERFSPAAVRLTFGADGAFSADVVSGSGRGGALPDAGLRGLERDGCRIACTPAPGGYRAVLRAEGGPVC